MYILHPLPTADAPTQSSCAAWACCPCPETPPGWWNLSPPGPQLRGITLGGGQIMGILVGMVGVKLIGVWLGLGVCVGEGRVAQQSPPTTKETAWVPGSPDG